MHDVLTGDTGLPAGVGVSHVAVYRTDGPDGVCGGAPHVHFACAEMYVAVGGRGSARFLTPAGPQEVALSAGAAVRFTPGTLHRLVSDPDDPLALIVLMENGHLNEAGDAVFVFPPEDLADPARYAELAVAADEAAVRERRDRAVTGFTRLTSLWRADPELGLHELHAFYALATALVRPRAAAWPALIAAGPGAAAARLAERAAAVQAADPAHLRAATVTPLAPAAPYPGMCGHVSRYTPVP
ncbi:cupin [Actinocorallia sp. A-T 12471]|uniref:cupin domain-containing protein n=1 Tax=Actinocorallia sp. A-T 12471 TaxID=3089813 RepID=UPI0029CF3D36|nr:cupin [Actinocorallia sp. A-T 12471]MDX6742347.1 cupin [Actinocorallia sp. A-T 12471]